MLKKLILLALSMFSLDTFAQNYQWAQRLGGPGHDIGHSIKVDPLGNVYNTGHFENTVDFDPGPGTYNLTSAGGSDIFVSKLDVSGNFIWAKSFSGTSDETGLSLFVDAAGNVYTTGESLGTVDFDPGADTFNLISNGVSDIFISKLEPSGNFAWAKTIGGTSSEWGNSVVVDASGNIYITGNFQDTVDFDPGPGVFTLKSSEEYDCFICKLNASGDFVWAKSLVGPDYSSGYSIALDVSGNIYTTGFFFSTVDFDPGPDSYTLTSAGGADVFISKLDPSGNFIWAKAIGGTGYEWGQGRSCLAIDPGGNIYLTGSFQNTADFDPGPDSYELTSTGIDDIFITKLDSSGNFVWAKRMGESGSGNGYSLALDNSNNIYVTGGFQGTIDFDPGPGQYLITSEGGSTDIFISKIDASGNFTWVKIIGAGFEDSGYSLAVDASGNVFTTGSFIGTVDFDPDAGIENLTSAGANSYDIFILKLGMTTGIEKIIHNNNFSVYPNPSNDFITLQTRDEQADIFYNITDLTGKLILRGKINTLSTYIEISGLSTGLYFVQVGESPQEFLKLMKL
ncbi:MAG: SBBP repeat-containing protein [Saprospiraceae bacterium]